MTRYRTVDVHSFSARRYSESSSKIRSKLADTGMGPTAPKSSAPLDDMRRLYRDLIAAGSFDTAQVTAATFASATGPARTKWR